MIPGNPFTAAGAAPPPAGDPNAPPTPVDEEAHFRLDDHQRQIDSLKQGDMKTLIKAIESLVHAIRELVDTRKV